MNRTPLEDRGAFVSVTVVDGFPDDLIERMRNDQIDVVFMRTFVANPEGIVIDTLLREAMVVALPRRARTPSERKPW
jgi:DNA-binding transcriptional LysR family regulator